MGSVETYRLSEWSTKCVEDHELTDEARELADELREESARRVLVEQAGDGVRIRTFAHVGVVDLGDFIVQIEPKMVGGADGLAALIDYAAGIDNLHRHGETWESRPEGRHLVELFALMFIESCEELVRRGLRSGYVEHQESLSTVRGRIRVREQLVNNKGRIDRIECRYDERDPDVWENRLLAAGLKACRHLVESPELRARVRRLLEVLEVRCNPERLDLRRVRERREYHRMNAQYRDSHELALLILEGLGVDEPYEFGSQSVHTFLLDMNRLFERFVGRLLTEALEGRSEVVRGQYSARGVVVDARTGASYTNIRPDFLVEGRGGFRLPVDAKYKQYGGRKVGTSDIYQLSTYAQAFGDGQAGGPPSAVLVYPAGSAEWERLEVKGAGGRTTARIEVVGLGIENVLGELEGR